MLPGGAVLHAADRCGSRSDRRPEGSFQARPPTHTVGHKQTIGVTRTNQSLGRTKLGWRLQNRLHPGVGARRFKTRGRPVRHVEVRHALEWDPVAPGTSLLRLTSCG